MDLLMRTKYKNDDDDADNDNIVVWVGVADEYNTQCCLRSIVFIN